MRKPPTGGMRETSRHIATARSRKVLVYSESGRLDRLALIKGAKSRT
jgi:hypothetical protein